MVPSLKWGVRGGLPTEVEVRSPTEVEVRGGLLTEIGGDDRFVPSGLRIAVVSAVVYPSGVEVEVGYPTVTESVVGVRNRRFASLRRGIPRAEG